MAVPTAAVVSKENPASSPFSFTPSTKLAEADESADKALTE